MHWMTYEYFGGDFHCGRPWHRYGIPYALPDCSSIEGPQGTAAPLQNALNYGNPGAAPRHERLAEAHRVEREQPDLRGHVLALGRARLAGGPAADGDGRQREPRAVRAPGQRATQLVRRDGHRPPRVQGRSASSQRYVDAQAGGPGKGFFQIVTDPYEARRVINQGRMAVVLEIEISELFGCRGWEQPDLRPGAGRPPARRDATTWACAPRCCSTSSTTRWPGVRFDSGAFGVVINAGQPQQRRARTGARRPARGPYRDNEIFTPDPSASAGVEHPARHARRCPAGTTPDLSAATALQHARPDRARPLRRQREMIKRR